MNVFCNKRITKHPTMTREQQAELMRQSAEYKGYEIINTGCSALDAKLLSLLQQNLSQEQQAIIVFKE